MKRLLAEDLDFVLREAAAAIESLQCKRVFITGGTGFFGCWLLETLLESNARSDLGIELTVLSRDPTAFARRMPHLGNHPGVTWVRGGILQFSREMVEQQLGETRFDAVIHLVTEADLGSTATSPVTALDVIAEGTRRALDFAVAVGATRFLFTSSGAVYGPRPSGLTRIPENFLVAPELTDLASSYAAAGNAKRYAELLCCAYAKQFGLGAVIARCFSFLGPHLPVDGKFAVGNFLNSAVAREDLIIKGDGLPVRSYLYAADLVVWLLTLLVRGIPGRLYNVGSERAISIKELAERVAAIPDQTLPVRILGAGSSQLVDHYVPDTTRARIELQLKETISLESALRMTYRWLCAHGV